MAVVDIRGRGGKMPAPEGDEKLPEKDPLKQTEDDLARAVRMRTLQGLAGLGPSGAPALASPAVKESSSLDVAGVVQAQSALVGTLITQIVDLVKVKPAAGADPLMSFVLNELKDVRARADSAPDPLVYLAESQDRLGAITQKLKTSLGLGEGTRVGTGDIGGMISLEEAKMEREERQRRWETDRDATNRQWQRENQRWEAEFNLKLKQFERDQEGRQNTTDMFGDLISSVITGLNVERGVTAAAPAAPAPAPAPAAPTPAAQEVPAPQPFPCPECQNPVTPPANLQPGQELKCPHCEATYKMQVRA